jgi:hypothetical protein
LNRRSRSITHGISEKNRQKFAHLDANSATHKTIGCHPGQQFGRSNSQFHVGFVAKDVQYKHNTYKKKKRIKIIINITRSPELIMFFKYYLLSLRLL